MPQSIPTGYIPRATPGDSLKENCPGSRDLTFESYLGAGNSTRAGILWNQSSNYAKRHINVCSGDDLCSPFFNIIFETPCMKVGLDVRISLVRVLSFGGRGKLPPKRLISSPQRKVSPEKKIKSYFE